MCVCALLFIDAGMRWVIDTVSIKFVHPLNSPCFLTINLLKFKLCFSVEIVKCASDPYYAFQYCCVSDH